MKYIQGKYYITLFGEFGEKLKIKTANTYLKALKKANKHMNKNQNFSAVINRVLWNSKQIIKNKR